MELWRRNLWVLWLAQVLAMVGMSAVVPFLPLFVRQLGINDTVAVHHWSGYVFSAPFLTAIIAQPIWGALADRYSRKTMVVRAVIGLAVAFALMGFSRNVQELFLWRLVQGGISGFIAATLGFVVAETPHAFRGYAIGVLQTSQSIGAVIGPFLGGIISHYAGMRIVFWIMSSVCVISSALVIALVREKSTSRAQRTDSATVWNNLQTAWQIPGFMVALACITLSQMGTIMPNPQMPFYLESLGIPMSQLQIVTGTLVGITGLATLVAAPQIGKVVDKHGPRVVVMSSATAAALLLIVQGVACSVETVFFSRGFLGIALAGLVPALNTFVSTRVPEGRQSGMMSLASSAMLLGNLISPPVGGWIAAHGGLRLMFFIAASCVGSVPVLLWWLRRRHVRRANAQG